jgi:hypothetical protein
MNALDRLIHALDTAVDDAVKTQDTEYVAEEVRNAIQLRTARGQFLTEGGGTESRTKYSKGHEKKRARLGLPIDRVTLFMGSVGVLEAMRARSQFRAGEVTIDVGYISGLSEERAMEIAGYLDNEGAGINHVTYPFVGLANEEESQILRALSARLGGNIQTTFNNL